jgi:hypothetical protein
MLSEKTLITKRYVCFSEQVARLLQNYNTSISACFRGRNRVMRNLCLWLLGLPWKCCSTGRLRAGFPGSGREQMSFFGNTGFAVIFEVVAVNRRGLHSSLAAVTMREWIFSEYFRSRPLIACQMYRRATNVPVCTVIPFELKFTFPGRSVIGKAGSWISPT